MPKTEDLIQNLPDPKEFETFAAGYFAALPPKSIPAGAAGAPGAPAQTLDPALIATLAPIFLQAIQAWFERRRNRPGTQPPTAG